jgi:intein-encoded DNA endonuclease-like protein
MIEQFLNIKSLDVAYVLGFLWADGYISKVNNSISTTINTKDFNDIFRIFEKIGDWKQYNYKRYDKRTDKYYNTSTIHITNKHLRDFLIENDYSLKSNVSSDKILEKIPNNLKRYFYKGYSDGDGCFYIKQKTCQYILTSTKEQDWNFIEKLYKTLNIRYNIITMESYSQIRITNKPDIIKIGEYLYENNDACLQRKFDKYFEITKIPDRKGFWSENDHQFLLDNYKLKGIEYCMSKLNRSKKSIQWQIHKLK